MSGYVKTNWQDNVTPLSATNFNNIENEIYKLDLLYSESIQGTTQVPTYVNGDITKIDHKQGDTVIRTDIFDFTSLKITETRVLNTGERIVLEYNFDSDGNYVNTVVS